ncbi:hypothetical protein HG15A2_24900 [Adhaeretor mobilis]|uniref:Uncharacterized protein n=1 Tax=Adhaeretor mobilis TaxID=1930276 RepID=A0A517MWF0_9BACT|nr:hypothetical protein HG15A2_24900 [Adhaeretor mobilis]
MLDYPAISIYNPQCAPVVGEQACLAFAGYPQSTTGVSAVALSTSPVIGSITLLAGLFWRPDDQRTLPLNSNW